MKVRDILKMVAFNLQRRDIIDCLEGKNADGEEELKKLFTCYKLVVSELNEEYSPLSFTETLLSKKGKIYFTSFSKIPTEILSVKLGGERLNYSVFPTYLQVDKNQVDVEYRYIPKFENMDEECPYSNTKITERILTLGVMREFLLFCGLYEEAVIYDEKFLKALDNVLLSKKGGIMKKRGWF